MKDYKGNLDMKVTKGTINRTETVTVKYEPAEKPTLDISLERPYEVEATGQQTGIQAYRVAAGGKQVKNNVKVSVMGVVDALKAAFNAYKNAKQTGGIGEGDVTEVKGVVDSYNNIIQQYNKVSTQTTELKTPTQEMKVEDLADQELSDLLKK